MKLEEAGRFTVHFLPPSTVRKKTRQEVELSYSSARSHLAKLLHRRRKVDTQAGAFSEDLLLTSGHGTRSEHICHSDEATESLNCVFTIAGSCENGERGCSDVFSPAFAPELVLSRTRNYPLRRSDVQRAVSDPGPMSDISQYTELPGVVRSNSNDSYFDSPTVYRPDPWSAASSELSCRRTATLMHHCVTAFWPGYDSIGRNKFHRTSFIACWSSLVELENVVFHASMWKSATHLSDKTRMPVADKESLIHHQKALQGIRRSLELPAHEIAEEVVFSVMILSTFGQADHLQGDQHRSLRFQPPYRDLEFLSAYSRGLKCNGHLAALYRLVEIKGGIDSLTLPGLAASVNYLDIIRSTHNLCRPFFAMNKLFHDPRKEHSREDYFGHVGDLEGLLYPDQDKSRSEDVITLLRLHGLSQALGGALQDMQVWVRVLGAYVDGTVRMPQLGLLGVNRDLIQHRLLSTISVGDSIDTDSSRSTCCVGKDGDRGPDMDRLVQLGLLIFSIGVTFPLTNPRLYQTLASRLKGQVQRDLSKLCSMGMQALAIWLCVLGCLAATQVEEWALRTWFIEALYQVERSHSVGGLSLLEDFAEGKSSIDTPSSPVRSWDWVKEVYIRPLLWYDDACDAAAKTVWEHVQRRVQL